MPISHPLVIFSGGKSTRMGRDKSLLPFVNHKTLTQYQIAKFSPYFDHIYIGCKTKTKFDFQANFIEDLTIYEDSAPYIGLISAFKILQSTHMCVLSVDTPFFDTQHFIKLLNHDHSHVDAIVAQSKSGNQPLCAIYKNTIISKLERLIEQKKYRFNHLFEQINVTYVPFEDDNIFTNLNFPQDYERVQQQLI